MNSHLLSPSLVLDIESVHTALKSLVYTTVTHDQSDLYFLALIDAFLNDSKMQTNFQTRRYALGCVLVRTITEQMAYLASLFEISINTERETFQEAVLSISRCAHTSNPELIGWCWLYYRHVRAELCISAKVFSDISCINERTLRRYQFDAVKHLTILLNQLELQMQRSQNGEMTSG